MAVSIEFDSGGVTKEKSLELMRTAADQGMMGHQAYFHGIYFLHEATRMKKARPQAERVVLAWCEWASAACATDVPTGAVEMRRKTEDILRQALPVWLENVERPRREQLRKAKSSKRSLTVSEKALQEVEDFRRVFDLPEERHGQEVDLSVFREPWCIPAIEKVQQYWKEQVEFVVDRVWEREVGNV